MSKPQIKRGIYFIADTDVLAPDRLVPVTQAALTGGVTLVQLRGKGLATDRVVELGAQLLQVTRAAGVPLLINDLPEIAAQIGAEGAHVGQADAPAARARELLGPDAIVGVTTNTSSEVRQAEKDEADYVAFGALFASPTKPDAEHMPLEHAQRLRDLTDLPVCAIGGISEANIGQLEGIGIDLVCVISAIALADDPEAATRRLDAAMRAWDQ